MTPDTAPGRKTVTRRTWMFLRVMETTDCGPITAMEAVSSTALAHPEWDMTESRTLAEWSRSTTRP